MSAAGPGTRKGPQHDPPPLPAHRQTLLAHLAGGHSGVQPLAVSHTAVPVPLLPTVARELTTETRNGGRVKPRLLDLFCGAGGAAKGYQRAGFYVVGVDIAPQPNYCGDEFFEADALRLLGGRLDAGIFWLDRFDAIHASPPCQAHSALSVMWNARKHENLIPQTRELLRETGLPYVIENVEGAPLENPVRICGASVGLGTATHELRRHRLFETNWTLLVPPCAHSGRPTLGVYGDHARDRRRARSAEDGQFRAAEGLAMAREAFEMPWVNWRELSQAIPPAYTELIGHQLLQHIRVKGEAA